MHNEAVLSRLPVRFGLHVEHVNTRPIDRIVHFPGRMPHNLGLSQFAKQILFFTICHDPKNLWFYQFHAHLFKRMGKGECYFHISALSLHDHTVRGNDHPKVSKGNSIGTQNK